MVSVKKILVVEDSAMVSKVLHHVIKQNISVEAHYAASFAEAKALLAKAREPYFAALVDLNLPDAPDGEVVDFTLQQGVPTIVLTGSFCEKKREALLAKGIVDYVTKEGRYSYDYAVNLVERLFKNQSLEVLVVDDSSTSRRYISELLKRHMYQVYTATDGADAIKVLLKNPDIKLLITDYHMPVVDGFELVRSLRGKYGKSDLIIIGLSGEGEGNLTAKFIKNGANDFLRKPFNPEEFYCRVMHNVESLELIEAAKDAVNRDELTGIYNRRYFFRQAHVLYEQALVSGAPLAAAVLDLDGLKNINDRCGHDAGDAVLSHFAQLLNESLGRFLVAHAGGGEFFVLMPGLDNAKALALLDEVRKVIANKPIALEQGAVSLSLTGGVTNHRCDHLDEQIGQASEHMQRGKEAGRDLILGDEESEGDDNL